MKVLQIVESAYRGTIEEQDDTIVWLSHTLKTAGGDLDVLLRGNAVNYVLRGQDASGLSIGGWKQTQPPRIAEDLTALIGAGVNVYYLAEDTADRGVDESRMIERVNPVGRRDIARLIDSYDHVWHW